MQIFGWMLRAVGLVLLCVLLLLGLIGLSELLSEDPKLALLSATAARVWFVVLTVVVALVLFWLVWRLLRAVVVTVATGSLFGDTAAARLIGLGVTALLFQQATLALLSAPLIALTELLRNLPENTRAVISSLYRSGDSESIRLEAVFIRLTDLLVLIGSELARTLDRAVQPVPLIEAALALALWALIGQLLRSVPKPSDGSSGAATQSPRLLQAWRHMTEERRWQVGLGVVFVAGGFLSITSIVAIPWLKEDKVPAGLTLESLQKALAGQSLSAEELSQILPQDFAKMSSPFEALEAALLKSPSSQAATPGVSGASAALTKANAAVEDPMSGYALEVLARTKDSRARAIGRAVAQRDELPPLQERVVKSALRAFETESTQPMSAQERLFFYRAIQRQVAETLVDRQQALGQCRSDVENADRDAQFLAQDAANALTASQEDAALRWNRVSGVSKISSLYGRACARVSVRSSEFVPPEAGSGWGPFGKMANWLLRTKSFALALISGMLGFGLLGAAIAAYIRTGSSTDARAEGGHELGRVVVRGLSAAVVLFLAVKGGLAVLAVGEQDPNAYVLFFLCLVGAVYSEDVWLWARAKFLSRIGNGSDDGGKKGGAPGGQERSAGDRGQESQAGSKTGAPPKAPTPVPVAAPKVSVAPPSEDPASAPPSAV
ncbi:hypothetical protein [Hydrogenophaga sp.]|uniref:hypothetical protein n=1 Tax=Hydrogenophaga sp. TaxID=1904254 RepID=UPI0025C2036F|nr:hypothetical protein [Hydrogenophaga sp.]MBT9465519.1 hypothetical protein [Hydrogenophaga sp.]